MEDVCPDGQNEWVCTTRRTMQEIVPGVFLGPYISALPSRHPLLHQHGVTHIVCVRHHSEAYLIKAYSPDKFHHLILNISDKLTENILCHFPVVKAFIDCCLLGGGKALIHGISGNSRSAALAIAYIMETFGMTFKEAYALVELKRFSICPNKGFVAQLAEYEPIYKAKRDFQLGHGSSTWSDPPRPKRSFEDGDNASGSNKHLHQDM